MRSTTLVAALIVTTGSQRALAQERLPSTVAPRITSTARAQIERVTRAASRFANPDAAGAAGFTSVLGWIPMMGTHWVNESRMLAGRHFDATMPSQLMFSPVGGKDSLVGVAYSYFAPVGDTTRPASFDGNPPWHEHPDLGPPGTTLVMLHVWMIDSPDGPFAGRNPFLPYWAVRLTPPPSARLADPSVSLVVRKAALGLAEVADTTGMFPVIAKRPPVHAVLTARRDSVRAVIPRLDVAQQARDWRAWDALAGDVAPRVSSGRATGGAMSFWIANSTLRPTALAAAKRQLMRTGAVCLAMSPRCAIAFPSARHPCGVRVELNQFDAAGPRSFDSTRL